MNKASFLILAATMVFTAPSLADRGGSSDGGGMGVVCRNPDGSLKSVEALDLWEAREIYGLNIISSDEPVEAQVDKGIERLQHAVMYPWESGDGQRTYKKAEAFKKSLKSVAQFFLVPNFTNVLKRSGVSLTQTSDSFEEAGPRGCSKEQIVRYKDAGVGGGTDRILIDQDLFERMDNTNLAALILHEALYTVLRGFGERTSVRVRRAVGYVMSGQEFKSLDSILKGPRVTCTSPQVGLFDYQTETKLHFYQLDWLNGGRPVLGLALEKFNGALAMGFGHPMSGQSGSPSEFYETLKKTGGGFGGGIPLAHSPTDFDTKIRYTAVGGGKAAIQLEMISNPGGVVTPSKIDLNCQYFAK